MLRMWLTEPGWEREGWRDKAEAGGVRKGFRLKVDRKNGKAWEDMEGKRSEEEV